MQHALQINIPDQAKSGSEFPLHLNKIKRWLRELPLVNIRETTQLYYHGLTLANRQACLAKLRLEIMETIRPTSRTILANLHKHLVARSFPLPPKTHQILQLYQAILTEMAVGYKIVVRDVAAGQAKLNNKFVTLSVHRAMRYLGEQLQLVAQVYAPTPEGIWQDINQLFRFAENNSLVQRPIKDTDYHEIAKSSILDVFMQISLLAMANPLSLHQGEAEKLAAFFEKVSAECGISENAIKDFKGNVHYINTNLDAPPDYTMENEVAISSANRYFDLNPLVDNLMAMIQGKKPDQFETIVSLSTLSRDLARRLLNSLATNPKRKFNRAQKYAKVHVAIGLNNISQAIRNDQKTIENEIPHAISAPNLDLKLASKEQHKNYSNISLFSMDKDESDTSYTWDMIAKGNLVTNEGMEQNVLDSDQRKDTPTERWQSWEMINQSMGGCRLIWRETLESKARVGELLGLHSHSEKERRYLIGVIRWMQYYGDLGLEIGLQMLGPNILPATVKFKDPARNHRTLNSTNVLVLFGIKALNQPPSIVTPPNKFKEGDRLIVKLPSEEVEVELSKLCMLKSTFNQFLCNSICEQKKDSINNEKEEFGALWSVL